MDLSLFDDIIDDDLEESMPRAYWKDTWTSIDDLVAFDGDIDMQDLEEMRNDDLVIDQKDVKIKNKNGERKLSWEEVSPYFGMPIEAAAGKLDMCLTSLKGNCRELGLKRWPHRKIKSLQNLIKFIQEQGKEGFLEETLVRGQVQILEREIELIKKNPDMNLTNSAKKMLQKGYKDNHKKKKLELIDASNHA